MSDADFTIVPPITVTDAKLVTNVPDAVIAAYNAATTYGSGTQVGVMDALSIAVTFAASSVSSSLVYLAALSDTKAVLVYQGIVGDTTSWIQACVLTISGRSVTIGPLCAIPGAIVQNSVVKVSATQALLAFTNNTPGSTSGVCVCTLNMVDSTLTAGAILQVAAGYSGRPSLALMSATTAIIVYDNLVNFLTVSGASVSAAAAVVYTTYSAGHNYNPSVASLSSTQAIVCYTGSSNGHVRARTLDGVAPVTAAGTELDLANSSGGYSNSICALSTTKAILVNPVFGSTNYLHAYSVTVSGTTPSLDATCTGPLMGNNTFSGQTSISALSATSALMSYVGSIEDYVSSNVFTVGGGTISSGTPFNVSVLSGCTYPSVSTLNATKGLSAYVSSDGKAYATLLTVSGSTVSRMYASKQNIYQSLQTSNTGHSPDTSPTWWEFISSVYAPYSATITYYGEEIVSLRADNVHELYMSNRVDQTDLIGANLGNPLTKTNNSTDNWLFLGSSNARTMFDDIYNTQTSRAESIVVTVTPGEVVNTVALLNTEGTVATITQTVSGYSSSQSLTQHLANNWYDWYYTLPTTVADVVFTDIPPYANSSLTITIANAGSTAKCGVCKIGRGKILGRTQWDFERTINDYSNTAEDSFGNVSLVPRNYSKRLNLNVQIPAGFESSATTYLESVRATPLIFIGSTLYASSFIYGFLGAWRVPFTNIGKVASIEIKGLV